MFNIKYISMKKFLLVLVLILLNMQICYSQNEVIDNINNSFIDETQPAEIEGFVEYTEALEEEKDDNSIYLDSTDVFKRINFSKPKTIGANSLGAKSKDLSFKPFQEKMDAASRFAGQEYNIRSTSSSYSKNFGNFSFGTTYDSYLYSAGVNYSTGFFTKYEGKHFALSTAFSKYTNSNYDSYSDYFFIAPELKLTKRLSFLDVMMTDVSQIYKKNELVLRYKPNFGRHKDNIQLELGAGQYFFEDNYYKSALRFSTRFKL